MVLFGIPHIMISGDVMGRLDTLYTRILKVTEKSQHGRFDALFCVGQFFAPKGGIDEVEDYIIGKKQIPILTYFIGDYGDESEFLLAAAYNKTSDAKHRVGSAEISVCHNLVWLKGSGITSVHGLRIAYLGGRFLRTLYNHRDASSPKLVGAYHRDNIDELLHRALDEETTDFFLSNEWPEGVISGIDFLQTPEEVPSTITTESGKAVVATIAKALNPRYHFAGTEGVHFARAPFKSKEKIYCQYFMGLGTVGNDRGQRSVKALALIPSCLQLHKRSLLDPRETKDYPLSTRSPYEMGARSRFDEPGRRGRRFSESKSEEPENIYWQFTYRKGFLDDMVQFKMRTQKTQADYFSSVCVEFLDHGTCPKGTRCLYRHEIQNCTYREKWCSAIFESKCKDLNGSACGLRHLTADHHRSDEPKLPASTGGTCFSFHTRQACERGAECRFIHYTDYAPGPARPRRKPDVEHVH